MAESRILYTFLSDDFNLRHMAIESSQVSLVCWCHHDSRLSTFLSFIAFRFAYFLFLSFSSTEHERELEDGYIYPLSIDENGQGGMELRMKLEFRTKKR